MRNCDFPEVYSYSSSIFAAETGSFMKRASWLFEQDLMKSSF